MSIFQKYYRCLILTLLVLIITGLGSAQALDITKIRFGEHPDKIRTVIELNKTTEFKAFTLPADSGKSYRIIIDLPSFDWKAAPLKHLKSGIITDVRTGDTRPDIMRIVFDLSKPMILKNAFILGSNAKNDVRLVIDSEIVSEQTYHIKGKAVFGKLLSGPEGDAETLDSLIAKHSEQEPVSSKENSSTAGNMVIPTRKPPTSVTKTYNNKSLFPLRKPLIVIDAGHGGADPGAVAGNLKEKDITLSAARILKKKLEATGRYNIHLTRNSDKFLKLYKRVSIARAQNADLFISLHADSINKSNVRGASIYTLSNKASDAQTARLAARENQADLIAGVDLSHEDKEVANILIDLAMRDTMNQSKFFANTVVENMTTHNVRILPRPHRYAGFAVLKAPDIPSVLFEMGFMSNRKEARLLTTQSYQEKIATALVKSIDNYFTKVRKNNS